jgi:hypothetical protein
MAIVEVHLPRRIIPILPRIKYGTEKLAKRFLWFGIVVAVVFLIYIDRMGSNYLLAVLFK